jgi:predicted DCC family thiol-disulfide oxidoreductase YuxK
MRGLFGFGLGPAMALWHLGRGRLHQSSRRLCWEGLPLNNSRLEVRRNVRSMVIGADMNEDRKIAEAEKTLRGKGWSPSDRVVVFDGVCVMCNSGVDFLLRWDTANQFKYAALQSDAGRALVVKYGAPADLSTMVYVENGNAYVRSEAVLRIAGRLGILLGIPAQATLLVIPRPLRDWFYTNVVAKNRYDVFGKRDQCRLVEPGQENRFLT